MSIIKNSIKWTAVLLYHRLKIAARRKHRYRLSSSAFCTGVIQKLAHYFNYSLQHITTIVGKNGINTKQIYKRAIRDSYFYEIESFICNKADIRICNSTTSSPIFTRQFESPETSCVVDNYCHTLIPVTLPTTNTNKTTIDNPNHTLELDKNSQLPQISVPGTRIDNKEKPSSRLFLNRSSINNLNLNGTLVHQPYVDDVNRRSSCRIATKNSLHCYNQWSKIPKYQDLIFVMDHGTVKDLPYMKLSEMNKDTLGHQQHYIAQQKRIEQFFITAGISNVVTHVHHLRDPHLMGIYGPYNGKEIQDDTLPTITNAYVHDPSHPLLATSNYGIDLIFIPTIHSACDSWHQCLSKKEIEMITTLKCACTDLDSLLNYQLTNNYTIRSAIDALSRKQQEYHHDVLHLRYCYHTISVCAEVHNFTSEIKNKITNNGVVVQQGIVKMVRSVLLKNSPKEAFSKLIIPLTKIAEFYLLQLPKGMFERRLPNAGSFFNSECSYISLNIYFDGTSWTDCPTLFYSKQNKRWLTRINSHQGLYLHKDENNWSFGVILIFGCDIQGFDQRYVTYALRLPCPGWCLVLGDYRHLLHAVSSGTAGLRFSLVVTNHGSAVRGVDENGKRVLLRNAKNYHLPVNE